MAAVTIDSIETIPLRIPFDHWAPPPLVSGPEGSSSRP
jgi:hypothetical protein